MSKEAKVLIFMGSDSDLKTMKQAARVLEELDIKYEVLISSAHRTPEQTAKYALEAEGKGIEVIIAGAGAAAHLAGVIAGLTTLPVIGVPLSGSALSGLDALYATVQMPGGIPVATVAVDGAKNAGILAAQILGVKYPEVRVKLKELKVKMASEVEKKNKKLQDLGIDAYLEAK